jgi:hypothetical protein
VMKAEVVSSILIGRMLSYHPETEDGTLAAGEGCLAEGAQQRVAGVIFVHDEIVAIWRDHAHSIAEHQSCLGYQIGSRHVANSPPLTLRLRLKFSDFGGAHSLG